jgi:hypothetical protein
LGFALLKYFFVATGGTVGSKLLGWLLEVEGRSEVLN